MTELLIIVALIAAGGVFAGAEIAVVALRKTRVAELARERRHGARALLALREEPERFLATVQVGITIVGATAAAFGGASIAERLEPWLARTGWFGSHAEGAALALVVAVVSYLSIVVGELVPKSLALRSAERYALLIGKPLYVLSVLARPVVWLLSSSANLLLKPFGDQTTFTEARHSREELQQIVEDASKAGTVHPDAGEIASRALDLPEVRARDVMVPRQDVVMIPAGASPEELARLVEQHPRSRFPVYAGQVDNVVGYVSVKDLLARALRGASVQLDAIMRPAYFVPSSKRAVELLSEMRERRVPMAVALEEQGGVAGIVTLEDLLEELVGDIYDEHAEPLPEILQEQADGSITVSGSMAIRHLNRTLGVELPDGAGVTTIAGLCLTLAGRLPRRGETLALDNGMRLEIVDVSSRKIRRVRLLPTRLTESPPGAQAPEDASGEHPVVR